MKELRIPFKGWDLIAFLNEKDGNEMVAVKPIAMAIGLSWSSQRQKITSDPDLSWVDINSTGSDGKHYQMLCLPVMEVNLWLGGISSKKVKEEIRPKLVEFKKECQIAIHNHMRGTSSPEVLDLLYKIIARLESIELENASLKAENTELKSRLDMHDRLAGIDASCSGKKLAAARHLKLVGE